MTIYVIYEIDEGEYWCGGRSWSWDVQEAMRLKSADEAEAAMRGLYHRNSSLNLMYRKMYTD